MQTLQETLDIYRNEALGAIYDSFSAFKIVVDATSDREKLLQMIDSSKILLVEDLILVHYPLKAGS